jgi:pilT domain-containing protein
MGRVISAIIYFIFGYLGLVLGYRREGEFLNSLATVKFGSKNKEKESKSKTKKTTEVIAKIIDTSALIDSRIHDVAQTGFLEGKIIVPEFVLKELQLIADSDDPLKRAKGRLGLDCVEDLQKMKEINLEIDNKYNYNEHKGVDNLLIDYALQYKCAIITTDYNLNKLATLQSIKVLNVNDLSNAVKPILTTGERLKVQVLREGKENNQGVAYTEDGTMIVVENGKRYVGKTIEVEVQSVLQTSSGRIIFTKIV